MVKVITYGTYDMLHYGHIRLLERAKALGDYLIVGITSDDYDKTRGKINLQQSLMERVEAVKATGLADEIIIEEYEGQKIDDIRRLDVDIFTVGSDWEGYFDYLNEFCKVVYLPRTQGVSSSEVRAEKRKLRIGLVGTAVFRTKFINEAKYVNGVEVVGIYASHPGNEPEVKDLFYTDNYDELLEKADAVYIISMPERHFEHSKKALLAGKHVLCESPIAYTREQCEELYKIAEENNLILMDAIKTAYSTAYERLILMAKSGKIGKVVSVDAVCTSLRDGISIEGTDLSKKWNSMCGWAPAAMLPVFQLFGTDYKSKVFYTMFQDEEENIDAFTKIDFIYPSGIATVKVAKGAKAEGELIITGTKGYIYVPAPWWKTDYFEIRYENQEDNKRFFYQLDGEGIRYEIVAFAKAVECNRNLSCISNATSEAIVGVIEDFNERINLTELV
ncbi:Gfo/Idh/MocA family oxidoreductase [Ruminococcus flavefaciens]|uniref:Gfo/Idh/MocA family oxidoreductase n=1 Tax=Ruminococcus flavefaciens TaxID=1265 RepID=UPI0026F0361D|nr:Gfo/Idh/MocA family oxidoreductase [Ruminococcus flavefaciens]MDD7517108.1 Gfo/Idh/MocA family oxidoreductase [Ruminococcus flavefaciens]MDY5692103.1 Gfo/Idh/MocA family oxidoreductase [Ruminococcus flavefaciens]